MEDKPSRDELLKRLHKKMGGRRRKGGGKPVIDQNKLSQMMDTFTGQTQQLKEENEQLKQMLKSCMSNDMKQALENYKQIQEENIKLKEEIKKLQN